MTDEPTKHPGGRPTDYRPEYCDSVVEWGKQGKSKAWMCATLDIARPTLDLWIETHEEFSYAMDVARAHAQLWWEDKGQENLETPSFQSSMWSRSMAARFPDDWREKTSQELTGPNGKPLNTAPTIIFTGCPPDTSPPEAVDSAPKRSD